MQMYDKLRSKLTELVQEHNLGGMPVEITTRVLTPTEAIGNTEKQDYPLIKGKEVLINATFQDAIGQAFTDEPSLFKGTIHDVLKLPLDSNKNRAVFTASLNAVMRHLGIIEKTVHCKNEEPESCAQKMVHHILENYGHVKVGLIGYQPAMLDRLGRSLSVRVLDLDRGNIGNERYGILVEDGNEKCEEVVAWADLLLVTGSTIGNATISAFMASGKPVLYYGTTVAGAACILGLKRACFYAK